MANQRQNPRHCIMSSMERFFSISLVCVVVALMTATAQGSIQSLDVPGGRIHKIQLNCQIGNVPNVVWFILRPGLTSPMELPSDATEYQPLGNGLLNILNVQASNEGLYSCQAGALTGDTQINVTVLGVPSFVGVLSNPGTHVNVTEGSGIEINISLIFRYGGERNVDQEITLVRLVHSTVSQAAIFYCSGVVGCTVEQTLHSGRISHTGQRSPWTNIIATINNAVLSDSGVYDIIVRYLNPDGQITNELFSNISVSVIQGSTTATPTVIPVISSTTAPTTTTVYDNTTTIVTYSSSSVSSRSTAIFPMPPIAMTSTTKYSPSTTFPTPSKGAVVVASQPLLVTVVSTSVSITIIIVIVIVGVGVAVSVYVVHNNRTTLTELRPTATESYLSTSESQPDSSMTTGGDNTITQITKLDSDIETTVTVAMVCGSPETSWLPWHAQFYFDDSQLNSSSQNV